jgi:hypothetical protein
MMLLEGVSEAMLLAIYAEWNTQRSGRLMNWLRRGGRLAWQQSSRNESATGHRAELQNLSSCEI